MIIERKLFNDKVNYSSIHIEDKINNISTVLYQESDFNNYILTNNIDDVDKIVNIVNDIAARVNIDIPTNDLTLIYKTNKDKKVIKVKLNINTLYKLEIDSNTDEIINEEKLYIKENIDNKIFIIVVKDSLFKINDYKTIIEEYIDTTLIPDDIKYYIYVVGKIAYLKKFIDDSIVINEETILGAMPHNIIEKIINVKLKFTNKLF
jgi:hypothetical protein